MTVPLPTQVSPGRSALAGWGDRLCCAALVVAGVAGVAVLAWYVWYMPAPY